MTSDEAAAALSKRYDRLVSLRSKAAKGKGAWYWAHFDPILIRDPETDRPASVKLNCTLCAAFSASNPSRTASEHLKSGGCPNFTLMTMNPINSQFPLLPSPAGHTNHRKRSSDSDQPPGTSLDVDPINTVYSSRFGYELNFLPSSSNPLVLSGGREDLQPLAQLEDSVKKLKSPKASHIPSLTRIQIETAFDLLADWLYESFGQVTFSNLEHPKFKSFLNQVGLPEPSRREFSCTRLNSKYTEARRESEARINEAGFFQVSCEGWKSSSRFGDDDECLVKFIVNLPNGTRVFQRAVCLSKGMFPSHYAEEVIWETVEMICGVDNVQRCVGIVGDKFKSNALRSLEIRNSWMVNIHCQIKGFRSLIKDFIRELPLFITVKEKCLKIANLVNNYPEFRNCIHKFRSHGVNFPGFIRVFSEKDWGLFVAMLEDVLTCSRILRLVVFDDSFKDVCSENTEVYDVIRDEGFWKELESVRLLVGLVLSTCGEIEKERPLVGQCLVLWDEFKDKLKKLGTVDNVLIERITQRRFEKNYHPVWSTAFILDPLNLVKDSSGKYLPCFGFLSEEQKRDVEKFVVRLVCEDEVGVVLGELERWRLEGLDPLYARAVQVRKRDSLTGKMKVANPQSGRIVWETCLKELGLLGKVAVRVLFMHATAFGFRWDWGFGKRVGVETGLKMVHVAANGMMERRDCSEEGVVWGEEEDE